MSKANMKLTQPRKIAPLFEELIYELWKSTRNKYYCDIGDFDYPDYGGIPIRISSKLSGDAVDYIQDHWDALKRIKTFSKFRNKIYEIFFPEFVSSRG